jgi:SNF2 family DNA or RNA helicase
MLEVMGEQAARDMILDRAYHLLGLGAPVEEDYMGYNKPDWNKMVALLPSLWVKDETDIPTPIIIDIGKLLRKYHRQIGEHVVSLIDEYIAANKDQENKRAAVTYKTIGVDLKNKIIVKLEENDMLSIKFSYNPKLWDALKLVPGAKPVADYTSGKREWTWYIPLVQIEKVIDKAMPIADVESLYEVKEENEDRIEELKETQPEIANAPDKKPAKETVEIIDQGDGTHKITFDYDREIVEAVKQVEGRRWNPQGKFWTVPSTSLLELYSLLSEIGVNVAGMSVILPKEPQQTYDENCVDWDRFPGLFAHQKQGIAFLLWENGLKGKILGDDMGLGKTRQTIIAAQQKMLKAEKGEKILVIVPASLKINWEREIHTVFEFADVYVVGKQWNQDEAEFATWIVINYDLLKKFEKELLQFEYAVGVLDEAHYIKNKDALRSKIILGQKATSTSEGHVGLVTKMEYRIALTGTPITSRPLDMFNLLRFTGHGLGGNYSNYTKRYCDGHVRNIGYRRIYSATGASNLAELHQKTRDVMLRRMKEECLDLPGKMRQVLPVEIDMHDYNAFWAEYKRKMAEEKKMIRAEHLVQLGKLKMAAAIGKIPATIEMADDIVESNGKVIIMTNYTEVADQLMAHYGDAAVKLTGETTQAQRQAVVDEFQNNPKKTVFVGNLRAAGVGITLTAATYVIMNDYSWVPAEHLQGEDRAYRIGQKEKVTILYMNAVGTIDEKIAPTLASKMEIISQAIDGKEVDENDITGDLIKALWGE